jgi:SWI/SNF-related matrix-associated actin-dependent regulator of chromatin subfamily A-like protein 1
LLTEKEVQIIKKSKDEFNKKAKFFIVSYDLSIRISDKIADMDFQMVVADEAHYLKSRESKRSKLMVPIMQKCKRVLLLSGTPILAKPVEIYPILKILRPDLFRSFKPFGSRYCDPKPTPFGIDWNGAINSKELHYILNNLMIRRLKKDVLSELPPKKRQKVEIQTDSKILNQIRVLLNKSGKVDFENENLMSRIINVEEEEKKEDDALSCFTKAYALTGKAKIVGIVDYVSYLLENNCKFLIFAHHRDVLNAIEEEVIKQKVKYVRIDGDVPTEKRHIHVNTFQNDDTCLVAVLGITACATGLTLTKASTVVFAEMHFTPAVMIQAEDRAHRIGQEHTCVNVHYLYGTDTVDEIIFPKLREKFFVVSSTLDDKRMDMDLQKIKSGCIGEFVTKNKKETLGGDLDEPSSANNLSNIENKKILSIGGNNLNKSGDKKGLKLTDFFKVKNKSEKKENTENSDKSNINNNINQEPDNKIPVATNSYLDDEYDELVEGILQDEEFIKSLTNSEIKPQQPFSPNFYGDRESTDVTNINLHQNNFKRDRKMYDPDMNEYSLLEDEEITMNKSKDGNNILNKRTKKEK